MPAANENVAPQQQEVANDNLDINDDPANQELAPVPANQNIGEGRGWEILDFNYHLSLLLFLSSSLLLLLLLGPNIVLSMKLWC